MITTMLYAVAVWFLVEYVIMPFMAFVLAAYETLRDELANVTRDQEHPVTRKSRFRRLT